MRLLVAALLVVATLAIAAPLIGRFRSGYEPEALATEAAVLFADLELPDEFEEGELIVRGDSRVRCLLVLGCRDPQVTQELVSEVVEVEEACRALESAVEMLPQYQSANDSLAPFGRGCATRGTVRGLTLAASVSLVEDMTVVRLSLAA